jgi:hypothetical protein
MGVLLLLLLLGGGTAAVAAFRFSLSSLTRPCPTAGLPGPGAMLIGSPPPQLMVLPLPTPPSGPAAVLLLVVVVDVAVAILETLIFILVGDASARASRCLVTPHDDMEAGDGSVGSAAGTAVSGDGEAQLDTAGEAAAERGGAGSGELFVALACAPTQRSETVRNRRWAGGVERGGLMARNRRGRSRQQPTGGRQRELVRVPAAMCM